MPSIASDLVWYQISLTYAIIQKKVSFSIVHLFQEKMRFSIKISNAAQLERN